MSGSSGYIDWWSQANSVNPNATTTDAVTTKPYHLATAQTGATHDSVFRDIKVVINPQTETGFSVIVAKGKDTEITSTKDAFLSAVEVVKKQISALQIRLPNSDIANTTISTKNALDMVADAVAPKAINVKPVP